MQKGQGALEYLLLIGGAVLVAGIVLVLVLGVGGASQGSTSNNADAIQQRLMAAGGGQVGLATNESFTRGGPTISNNPNAGWTLTISNSADGSNVYGVTNSVGHYGASSYSVNVAYNNPASGCNSYVYQDLPVTQNKNYTVSGWVKTISEPASSGVFISTNPCNGAWNWSAYQNITGTNDWTQVSATANSGSCTSLRFGFNEWYCPAGGGNTGQTYFTDMIVKQS